MDEYVSPIQAPKERKEREIKLEKEKRRVEKGISWDYLSFITMDLIKLTTRGKSTTWCNSITITY
jgi:hypothetical protein|tara:strand:+ start:68 stop:262 length:195 start_codon:yes stop_codon:yes gene_type:complete